MPKAGIALLRYTFIHLFILPAGMPLWGCICAARAVWRLWGGSVEVMGKLGLCGGEGEAATVLENPASSV